MMPPVIASQYALAHIYLQYLSYMNTTHNTYRCTRPSTMRTETTRRFAHTSTACGQLLLMKLTLLRCDTALDCSATTATAAAASVFCTQSTSFSVCIRPAAVQTAVTAVTNAVTIAAVAATIATAHSASDAVNESALSVCQLRTLQIRADSIVHRVRQSRKQQYSLRELNATTELTSACSLTRTHTCEHMHKRPIPLAINTTSIELRGTKLQFVPLLRGSDDMTILRAGSDCTAHRSPPALVNVHCGKRPALMKSLLCTANANNYCAQLLDGGCCMHAQTRSTESTRAAMLFKARDAPVVLECVAPTPEWVRVLIGDAPYQLIAIASSSHVSE
eukprot:13508-Heterococcus_DN1.PRE.3